ncbi:MAG: A24 family peptidase [Chloroflexi bacterium]|nr:A24 family peptidase [Chloroflexota bacterium]
MKSNLVGSGAVMTDSVLHVDVLVPSAMIAVIVLAGAYTDTRWRRLPNWLTLGGALAGLLLQAALRGLPGALDGATGWLLGCALLFLPFALGGMGAGDVKLLGAVGAARGPGFVLIAFVCTALLGGAISLVMMARAGTLLPALRNLGGALRWAGVSLVRYRMVPQFSFPPRPRQSDGAGTQPSPRAAGGGGPVAGQTPLVPYGVAIAAGTLLALGLGY